jgi:hypothetical protein
MLERELIMRLEDILRVQDAEIEKLGWRLISINESVYDAEKGLVDALRRIEELEQRYTALAEKMEGGDV